MSSAANWRAAAQNRSFGPILKRVTSQSTSQNRLCRNAVYRLNLVLAHERGTVKLDQVWPKPIDVKAIRKRVKMSQAEFSSAYGISKRALQEWE